jgi:hypothetical protein
MPGGGILVLEECLFVLVGPRTTCACRPLCAHRASLPLKPPLQDNGKPIWYSRNADIPLSYDHIRYYAG